jgi:hypothetical protein
MKNFGLVFVLMLFLLSACSLAGADPSEPTLPAAPDPLGTDRPEAEETPDAYPPVTGPDPDPRIAVFYYPWYGNPETDGSWIHWDQNTLLAPEIIGTDYYPVLGAYSANDPAVVAQHFAWMRQYGIGVAICTWWGQGTFEDQALPLLLEMGERYGIKIAFHIEPYRDRNAENLVRDIKYLYAQYGDSPAFYRTTQTSRWSPDASQAKGLFFVWASSTDHTGGQFVEPEYWQAALDEIHALPDGAIVIADTPDGSWVDGGHFDGLYNYATLTTGDPAMFGWASSLPPDAWFVPSVLPGFSAIRIEYDPSTYVPRQDGATYNNQWQALLDTGLKPEMVTITSFNEWHEGTQIEPALPLMEIERGEEYSDYQSLPPEGYLALTREWADRLRSVAWPHTVTLRIRFSTISDWSTLGLVSGGNWIRPDFLERSQDVDLAGFEGSNLALIQPLAQAESGNRVALAVDLQILLDVGTETLTFHLDRGGIGSSTVAFYRVVDGVETLLESYTWSGHNDTERNTYPVTVTISELSE